jgi:two-component system, NarL family, nitrate/nitrite response regulator NarL
LLSPSERKVKELVLLGLSNKKIASRLGVTEKTIKFHLTNIFAKIKVQSRAELIVSENIEKGVTIEEIKLFRTLMKNEF